MGDLVGTWVGIVLPIVIGVGTALVLAWYAERERARRLKDPKAKAERWPVAEL